MSFLLNNAARSGALQSTGANRVTSRKLREAGDNELAARGKVGGDESDASNPLKNLPLGQKQAGQAGKPKRRLVRRRRIRRKAVKRTWKQSLVSTKSAKEAKPQKPALSRGEAALVGKGKLAKQHLLSKSLATKASVKFEQQSQGRPTNPLSPAGRRRNMLNNLTNMVRISLAQHTGGKAGEAYPRRETRQILMALQGLKSSSTKKNSSDSRNKLSVGEFKLKESSAASILAIFAEPPQPPEGYEPVEMIA